MSYLTREEKIAIQEGRIAAKRSRVMPTPSVQEMSVRKAAICRVMAFENLAFVERTRRDLLAGHIDGLDRSRAISLLRGALQKARRNDESARFSGLALYRL